LTNNQRKVPGGSVRAPATMLLHFHADPRRNAMFMFLSSTVARSAKRLMRSKLTFAGALAACALGALAITTAWATPGKDISTTIVSGPIELGNIRIKTDSDVNAVQVKTKGVSDVYVVRNVIKPGGHTGWHTHPGPSIISVVSGRATEYRSDDDDFVVHEAGSAFVDEGGDHAHLIVNEGDTDLVLVAFQILPSGEQRRIDVPEP
jgi:quercetin dioxygenase-like cupin family protein